MKISAKGRYGIAAMVYLARNYETSSPITIISISDHLGISKIYLEQVFPFSSAASLSTRLRALREGISSPASRVRLQPMTFSPLLRSP